MGLREEAEKIIADEDAAAAAAVAKQLALARSKVPEAMAEWSAGMGLATVPAFTITGAEMVCVGDDDGQSANVEYAFEADGLEFSGGLKLYLGRVTWGVGLVGSPGPGVRTVADLARALRRMKESPPSG